MKILVISESINVEDSSASKVNVAFINNLKKAQHQLKVLHFSHKEITLPEIDCILIKERRFGILFILSRLVSTFQRITKVYINRDLEKLFGFSFTHTNDTIVIAKAIRKNIDFNPDLVITLSKGGSFRPHRALLRIPELHNIWIAYMHDPYPFHFYPRPYNWVESGYKQKEHLIREISLKARYSSFPSLLLKEWMGSYFSNFLKTGVIIPHQNADYKINDVPLPDYFDPYKFNLLHAGNLMPQRSPQGLIEGYKLFLSKNAEAKKNSKLILLGSASAHTQMLEDYKSSISEIHIHNGNVPFDLVYKLQKNVSANIILESKSEISPFLPGKFPHCVEANKPIISLAPYYCEVKRLLGDEYPYWSEVDDIEKIAAIIEELYQIWKLNPDNLVLNRKDLLEYLSFDYLNEVINSLK